MKKKIFLAITSEKNYNSKKNTSTLLLGSWCIQNSYSFSIGKKIKTHIYHWDNKKKLIKDYSEVKKIYNQISKDLAIFLNKIHNKNFSQNYWEQIYGYWLLHYVVVIFDRYMIIKSLKKKIIL